MSCRGACYECSDSTERGGTYLRIPGDFDVTAVLWLSEEGEGANLTCGATRHQETMAIEVKILLNLELCFNVQEIKPDDARFSLVISILLYIFFSIFLMLNILFFFLLNYDYCPLS